MHLFYWRWPVHHYTTQDIHKWMGFHSTSRSPYPCKRCSHAALRADKYFRCHFHWWSIGLFTSICGLRMNMVKAVLQGKKWGVCLAEFWVGDKKWMRSTRCSSHISIQNQKKRVIVFTFSHYSHKKGLINA